MNQQKQLLSTIFLKYGAIIAQILWTATVDIVIKGSIRHGYTAFVNVVKFTNGKIKEGKLSFKWFSDH